MTTILVIDDDAEARQFVRLTAPADWQVEEAADGLIGLSIVRRKAHLLKLIVLDLGLPAMEGRSVCAMIRECCPTVPILPFTGMTKQTGPLAAFGCLKPIFKPAHPDVMRAALVNGVAQPAPPIRDNPLVELVQEQSAYIERLIQQQHGRIRVVAYAATQLNRRGLSDLLRPLPSLAIARTLPELRRLVGEQSWTALVCLSSDYEAVLLIAREHGVRMVLIGRTGLRARIIGVPEVACLIDQDEPLIQAELLDAIEALATGGEPSWSAATSEDAGATIVPLAVARRFADTPLTERQIEVLWLDYQGLSASAIADRLQVEVSSLDSYWKRARRRLSLTREALRAWVRERLASDPGDPK